MGVKARLGDPVEVMLAPEGDERWGYFMFPSIWRLRDGRLVCAVTIGGDNMPADMDYHYLWYISYDERQHWTHAVIDLPEARDLLRERFTLASGRQVQSFVAFPKAINIENYALAWKNRRYFRALANTLIVTAGGVALVVLFSAMAAYRIARWNACRDVVAAFLCRFDDASLSDDHDTAGSGGRGGGGLLGSRFGFIIVAAGFLSPFTIYLYRGFFVQVPMELEEAASMEAAGAIHTFFFVAFPSVKPVTVTVMINTLGIWNDFNLSVLLLQEPRLMTLQLS